MVRHKKGSASEHFEPLPWSTADDGSPHNPFDIPGCRFLANPEIATIVPLITVACRRCRVTFCVCRSCWRGQAYCCARCRYEARRESLNRYQRRYRQTRKGKAQHCLGERRRRLRKKSKSMDDQASPLLGSCANLPFNPGTGTENSGPRAGDLPHRCRFCGAAGEIVKGFPVRGGRMRLENHREGPWWKRE